jgi:hypothetical protein
VAERYASGAGKPSCDAEALMFAIDLETAQLTAQTRTG